ncbi:hypothetical protein [Trichlorobacter lovleyi]|nr:hypothetical protein [Trichlorobacter lovleyi]
MRDGINIARYALKMSAVSNCPPREMLATAVERILGDEALPYLS